MNYPFKEHTDIKVFFTSLYFQHCNIHVSTEMCDELGAHGQVLCSPE